jgi:hypothetical protein
MIGSQRFRARARSWSTLAVFGIQAALLSSCASTSETTSSGVTSSVSAVPSTSAGVTGSTVEQSSKAVDSPCDVLPESRVTEALQVPSVTASPEGRGKCEYRTPDAEQGGGQLSVDVVREGGAERYFDDLTKGKQPVDGVGLRAALSIPRAGGATLYVLLDKGLLAISAGGARLNQRFSTSEQWEQMLKPLAVEVIQFLQND